MAVTTNPEEATTGCWSHVNAIFRKYWSKYGAIWLESVVQNLVPSSPVRWEPEEKQHSVEESFEESGKQKEGIAQHCEKPILSNEKYGKASKMPVLIGIFFMFPHLVMAYDPDCSIWKGKRNDATLDVYDVNASLSERGIFNGSNKNYDKICPDVFTHSPVRRIILSHNNLSSLPVDLLRGVGNLEEAELQDNLFTEFPIALNSSETVRYVNLAGNNITRIEKYSMNGMSRLMVLDLSRTEMKSVPEDIFDMSLKLVHLSQTKLDRLPLPPPTRAAFNVTLVVGEHGNELSVSYPDSRRRTIGINITGIDTLTCENARSAVEMYYDVLGGEIVCGLGSFRKIDILLKGKSRLVPSWVLGENAINTKGTMSAKVAGDISPHTLAPNQGAVNSCSDSRENRVSLHFLLIMLVIGLIVGESLHLWSHP